MEKGLIPSSIEIFLFVIFVGIMVFVGWQVLTQQNGALDTLVKYCDNRYGANNWTLQNG